MPKKLFIGNERGSISTARLFSAMACAFRPTSWFLTTTGRYEESIKEKEKGDVLSGASPEQAAAEAIVMEKAFKSGGEKRFWQKDLELELKAGQQPGASASPFMLAADYAMAGQTDKAFEYLEKSYEEREGQDLTLFEV
jgi:hypothetical protein